MQSVTLNVKLLMNGITRKLEEKSREVPKWLLVALLGLATMAFAQDNNSDWQAPVNLSSSGSATDPQFVLEESGVVHVLWRDDAVNSFIYMREVSDLWTDAESVELPFGSRRFIADLTATEETPLFSPVLVVDTASNIHAFWLDDESTLFHSSVPARLFNEILAWQQPQLLATAASGVSATIDESGRLHISYIQAEPTETVQPGIYYRQLASINGSWSAPQLIYPSSYFRQLSEAQANTHLAAKTVDEATHLYLVWDNQPLEKVFFARSVDGGLTWEEPTVIDERLPEDGPEIVGPTDIMVTVDDENVLLMWQAGHDLDPCSQYYQISTDNGATWQLPEFMLEDTFGCPEGLRPVGRTDAFSLFFFYYQDRPYLQAWDGRQWSEPQIQQDLSSFVSPETFRQIDLGCHQLEPLGQDQLLAIGCGAGQSEQTQDIWQLSRLVGDINAWFPPTPVWEEPEAFVTGGLNVLQPIMAADSQGRIHAVWSQMDETSRTRSAINYAYWEEGQWSPAVPVLTSPSGDVAQLEMTIKDEDQLLVIWVSSSEELYFSHASSDEAILRSEWSTPIELPSEQSFVGGADIAVSDDGSIHVAYSVPINEGRGIYLTESSNDGRDWSESILALDGTELGWEIVGTPRLEVTNDGRRHLLVFEETPQAGDHELTTAAVALFYSRSDSSKGDFSQPQLISETASEWADLVADEQSLIHRLWQEQTGTVTNVKHEYSTDRGSTWSGSLRVTDQQGPISVAVDNRGQLHAIQIGSETLFHRIWNGQQWLIDDGLEARQFEAVSLDEPQSVSVVAGPSQNLATIFTGQEFASGSTESLSNAYFTWRIVDESVVVSLPTPDPTTDNSNSEMSIEELATPEIEATATTMPATNTGGQGTATGGEGSGLFGFLDTDNNVIRTLLAIVPVALFLAIIAGIGIAVIRRTSR